MFLLIFLSRKIVEDVNAMLAKVTPEDFKELVNSDWLNTKKFI